MLPQYKKCVPCLVIGCLEPRLWQTWIRVISNGAPFTEVKQRKLLVASNLPKKQPIIHTRVTWKVYMPKLSDVHTQWWWKKWVNGDDGVIFRAKITKLSFAYNPLTETITAGLDYTTEFYCDERNTWNPI